MNELTVNLIEEENLGNAWWKAIQYILMNGTDLTIGGVEERKEIRESCMLISLTGNAIKQIERRELHPQFPTQKKHLDIYCKEFTYEYLREYYNKPIEERFSYTYYDRLVAHDFDQIECLRYGLGQQISMNLTSNRQQAITWIPETDFLSNSSPCLQRIMIRYIPNDKVDVHLTWRSHDLFGAFQSNIICLIDMLNREVIKPNNCHILRIIDYSDSLHIYKTDIKEAKNVRAVNI